MPVCILQCVFLRVTLGDGRYPAVKGGMDKSGLRDHGARNVYVDIVKAGASKVHGACEYPCYVGLLFIWDTPRFTLLLEDRTGC
jgi:hypothetical protein